MQEGSTVSVNIEASLAQPDNMQKAFLRKDSVEWEDGDVIRVNNRNYTIHRHEGGVGYFHGDANTFKSTFDGANHWFAVYPASLANQTQMIKDGNTPQICVTIPQTQYYQAVDESNPNTCLKDMNYMVAYTKTMTNNSISLQFMNLCAVFKIGLKAGPTSGSEANFLKNYSSANQRVKKIVLYTSTDANAAFHGNGFVMFASNKVTDNMGINIAINMDGTVTNDNRKLILDCTKQRVKDANGNVSYNTLSNGVELNSSTYTYFYIMVPINLTAGLTDMCMEVFDQHGNMMKKTLHGITVKKNQMYKSDLQLKCQYSANSFIDADFSVDATHTVKFTSGNLQYQCSTKVWRFAPYQYGRIGKNNKNVANGYDGYIDLFCYGTSGYNKKYPYSYGENLAFYPKGVISQSNYDWGWYNYIGGHPKQAFFLWTKNQVLYLLQTRTASTVKGKDNARYAIGKVGDYNGIFLFPDEFTLPNDININASNINIRTDLNGANAPSSAQVNHSDASCTNTQLVNSKMVFLPCAGQMYGTKEIYSGTNYTTDQCIARYANYHVSDADHTGTASGINLNLCWPYNHNNSNKTSICYTNSFSIQHGHSVRLILSNY